MDKEEPLTRQQKAQLPKARLFWMRRWLAGMPRRVCYFRNANAAFVVLFGLVEIGWRMPWLPHVARQNHPHLFANSHQEEPTHDQ